MRRKRRQLGNIRHSYDTYIKRGRLIAKGHVFHLKISHIQGSCILANSRRRMAPLQNQNTSKIVEISKS